MKHSFLFLLLIFISLDAFSDANSDVLALCETTLAAHISYDSGISYCDPQFTCNNDNAGTQIKMYIACVNTNCTTRAGNFYGFCPDEPILCPDGTPAPNDDLEQCPEVDCPEKGTVSNRTKCVAPQAGDIVQINAGFNGDIVADKNYCTYELSRDEYGFTKKAVDFWIDKDDRACLAMEYKATGDKVPEVDQDPNSISDYPNDATTKAMDEKAKKLTKEINTDNDPVETTSNPDGSISSKTKITTHTKDKTIEKVTIKTYVRTDGKNLLKETETETTTHADGTKTITENTTYTDDRGNTIKINDTGGVTKEPSGTEITTKNTTTEKDSNGNTTGSDTTITSPSGSTSGGSGSSGGSGGGSGGGSSSGVGDDTEKEGECDTAAENCEDFKEILMEVDEGPSKNQERIDKTVTDYNLDIDEYIETIGVENTEYSIPETELGNTLKSIFGSGSCGDINIPATTYMPAWSVSCADTQLTRDILGWILYISMAFYLFNLVTDSVKPK